MSVEERLVMELHGEGEGVEHDGHEHGVLADGGGGEGPEFVLERILGDVSSHRLGVQSKLDAVPLKVDYFSVCI